MLIQNEKGSKEQREKLVSFFQKNKYLIRLQILNGEELLQLLKQSLKMENNALAHKIMHQYHIDKCVEKLTVAYTHFHFLELVSKHPDELAEIDFAYIADLLTRIFQRVLTRASYEKTSERMLSKRVLKLISGAGQLATRERASHVCVETVPITLLQIELQENLAEFIRSNGAPNKYFRFDQVIEGVSETVLIQHYKVLFECFFQKMENT